MKAKIIKFLKDFLNERGHAHFSWGALGGILFTRWIFRHMHLEQIPLWFEILAMGGVGLLVGTLWEFYWNKKGAPFSISDVIWTGIGVSTGYLLTL